MKSKWEADRARPQHFRLTSDDKENECLFETAAAGILEEMARKDIAMTADRLMRWPSCLTIGISSS